MGRLSQNAYRIDDEHDLLELPDAGEDTRRYADIVALAGVIPRP